MEQNTEITQKPLTAANLSHLKTEPDVNPNLINQNPAVLPQTENNDINFISPKKEGGNQFKKDAATPQINNSASKKFKPCNCEKRWLIFIVLDSGQKK